MVYIGIIDDDGFMRAYLEDVFAEHGYVAIAVSRETQLIMTYSKYDLKALVIDIHLEGISDGINLASKFRDFGLKIPIIFYTNDNTEATRKRASKISNSRYVLKDNPMNIVNEIDDIKKSIPEYVYAYSQSLTS